MLDEVHEGGDYNPAAVRQLLLAAFTAEELRRFCQDEPILRPVLASLGPKYNLNDMVDEVLFYCEPRALVEPLVDAVRQGNPRQYARFQRHLRDPNYTAPAPTGLERLPLPLRKLAALVKQAIAGDVGARHALANRQAMLDAVSKAWIRDVLEPSLRGATWIDLAMEEQAAAVAQPWAPVVQVPGEPRRPLPPGTRIADIFDGTNGSLLILGGPGSGKTTMLLELARDCLDRAEEDPTRPIPVVLNLSSWADKEQPLADWLVEELRTRYYIPRRIARPWVENEELLLLLDGLDEVRSERRGECVTAINDFCQEYLVSLAVCSRLADYQALPRKLCLRSAVLVRPLTPEQIDGYLAGAGTDLLAVRQTLQHDPTLQEMAQTPLVLSIMALAYRGQSMEDLAVLQSVADRRRHLFDSYVQAMFARRSAGHPRPPEQAVRWLAWLAHQMAAHNRSQFLIEGLQPAWLPRRWQQWLYALLSRALAGPAIGLLGLLTVGLLGYATGVLLDNDYLRRIALDNCLLVGQVAGAAGLLAGFVDAVRLERKKTQEDRRLSMLGPALGLCLGLILGIYMAWDYGDQFAWNLEPLLARIYGPEAAWDLVQENTLFLQLLYGLVAGLIAGLVAGLVFEVIFVQTGAGRRLDDDVSGVDAISWSWAEATRGALSGLVLGLLFGSIWGALLVLNDEGPAWPAWILTGMVFGGLAGGVLGGLRSERVEGKTMPNQGTWLSARNALQVGMITCLTFGLGAGVVDKLFFQTDLPLLHVIVENLLTWGLFLGTLAMLRYGALDVSKHCTLRLILFVAGLLPLNLARFLTYATERIFLFKSGGGYMFIHPLLQEYFASRWAEEMADSAPDGRQA